MRAKRGRVTKELNINYIWIYLYITKARRGHQSEVGFDNFRNLLNGHVFHLQ